MDPSRFEELERKYSFYGIENNYQGEKNQEIFEEKSDTIVEALLFGEGSKDLQLEIEKKLQDKSKKIEESNSLSEQILIQRNKEKEEEEFITKANEEIKLLEGKLQEISDKENQALDGFLGIFERSKEAIVDWMHQICPQ